MKHTACVLEQVLRMNLTELNCSATEGIVAHRFTEQFTQKLKYHLLTLTSLQLIYEKEIWVNEGE